MIAETGRDDVKVTNHGYQAGNTVPATEPGRGPDEIHHLAGNLQVWCGDGPDGAACGPGVSLAARGSVEHPRDHAGDTPAPGRHLPGASRGVGIRLVRDHAATCAVTAAQVAEAVSTWVRSLAGRDRPLRDLDEALARALEALQADRGLRPHVGAGAGEPGRD